MGSVKENLALKIYGKIMDDALEAVSVQVLIELPEGTLEARVTDNVEMGSMIQFYAILNAIKPVAQKLRSEITMQLSDAEWEKVVDGMLEMVKDEIMEATK